MSLANTTEKNTADRDGNIGSCFKVPTKSLRKSHW